MSPRLYPFCTFSRQSIHNKAYLTKTLSLFFAQHHTCNLHLIHFIQVLLSKFRFRGFDFSILKTWRKKCDYLIFETNFKKLQSRLVFYNRHFLYHFNRSSIKEIRFMKWVASDFNYPGKLIKELRLIFRIIKRIFPMPWLQNFWSCPKNKLFSVCFFYLNYIVLYEILIHRAFANRA